MQVTKQIPLGIRDIKGNEILAYIHAAQGRVFTECRPFCLAIGLDWKSQHVKLKSNPKFTCGDITTRDSLGRSQVMTCIPVEQLPDWIMSINANKVAKEKREVLLQLQKVLQHGLNELVNERYVTSSEMVAELEAQIRPLKETIERLSALIEQLMIERAQDKATIDELRGNNAMLEEKARILEETNNSLWRARDFQASSHSYGMHATKAHRKAERLIKAK
jgi:5-carboxymethyl-2-hydroxymuconate isomerase